MRRTTRIFCASSPRGAATLAAALDAGLFEPADRRLLLVANDAVNPETTPAVDTVPGFSRIGERFDEVLSWNETIAPFHPGGWSPRADDVPLWERYVRRLWDLADDEVRLVVESVHTNPSLALCQLFPGAPVDVYSDGLMTYGPTPDKVPPLIGTRIDRLLYTDLVPGLAPLLLTEYGVPPQRIPSEAVAKALGELAEDDGEPTAPPGEPPALLFGQCLAALDVLTAAEETELHVGMVRGAAGLGHRHVVFKPHPAAHAHRWPALEAEASRLGVCLTVLDPGVPDEVAVQWLRPALAVGCVPTGLLTAATLYRVPAARVGTGTVLARLTPYENALRVPVTVVDALLPDVADRSAVTGGPVTPPDERVAELGALLKAVAFAMRPRVVPGLRPAAEEYLAHRLDSHTWRYFKRRRLTALGLPGGVPTRLAFLPRNPAVRRVARRARALARR
ncbi:alpha-2,8-polysialyltransferase family protein [Streptomyces sp. AC602_WCS936]|uniref:alpha-2,8-polysialyltransferase family protein n=1 Tax=Streptomyces sp. AC602_WCS936 TaxID=2823685 RepID=UPI001C2700BE|nr:alpha-2,8-polysialyltransferase family protein [Streptomyces sp. AC602_WCS936]